jgi:hypothetical protein
MDDLHRFCPDDQPEAENGRAELHEQPPPGPGWSTLVSTNKVGPWDHTTTAPCPEPAEAQDKEQRIDIRRSRQPHDANINKWGGSMLQK